MKGRVFLSYSNHDAAVADALCQAIEGDGHTCWMAPRDIQPSSDWAEQIIDGIQSASVMLLVFSSASNRSPQVRREVERAINREIPVIPFRIENVIPVKSLEYFLSTQHWFDAYAAPLATYLPRLRALVRTLADREPEGPPELAAAAPAPAAVPAPTVHRDDDLAFITSELARHIGPIARFLVQRASVGSANAGAMIDSLADELKDPVERKAFIATCRRRLAP